MNPFKSLLHRVMGIDIIKVFSLNALSTFIRMLAGMVSVKVVAVIIGPAGIALLGQLNNFSSILLGMSNGGINAGVTKYIAETKDDKNLVKVYISNALRITLICSLMVSLFLIVFCKQLSELILLSDEYYYVYIIFGLTIILFTLNGLATSILNGYKEFKLYVRISILGTVSGLIYSVILVYFFGLHGALINAVTFQSVMLFVTLWMCRKMPWMKREFFVQKVNKAIIKKYLGYSLMTLTTLALLPTCQMLLRGYVISELSPTDAGIWEGMNRISNMYLGIITSAFSIYYLPRLSEITNPAELRREVLRCYKVVVPMLLIISVFIFVLKRLILWILFTPDFYPMESLFGWQLAGDMFKMSSWLLSYLMVAKAMAGKFVITEVAFNLFYLVLAFLFMKINGIVGLTQGYLITYMIYMIIMIIMFRNIIIVKTSCDDGYNRRC